MKRTPIKEGKTTIGYVFTVQGDPKLGVAAGTTITIGEDMNGKQRPYPTAGHAADHLRAIYAIRLATLRRWLRDFGTAINANRRYAAIMEHTALDTNGAYTHGYCKISKGGASFTLDGVYWIVALDNATANEMIDACRGDASAAAVLKSYAIKRRHKSAHRVQIVCPVCGKKISAGRVHQHAKVHGIDGYENARRGYDDRRDARDAVRA